MPAHMKASPYITAHYRSGIHASNTAWTALIRYRGDVFTISFYSQYNRPMVGILAAAQVGHCLSAAFGSHHRREGQTPSADWVLYSQYSQLIVGILAAPQVSHYLRTAFGLHHRREGQALSVDWGFLPSYLSVDASLYNVKYWIFKYRKKRAGSQL